MSDRIAEALERIAGADPEKDPVGLERLIMCIASLSEYRNDETVVSSIQGLASEVSRAADALERIADRIGTV